MMSTSSSLPADRLALLYRLSQTFNSTLDLDEVLNRVIDEVIAATRAERGFLMLRDASGQLMFRASRGMDHRTIESPQFQISRGLAERVARDGRPMVTSDAQSDMWLSGRASVVLLGLRSILCVPLKIKGATLGVVYADNRMQAGIFTEADLELLVAIASSAAVAIENARLYQVAVEKGRMERELQLAREVQTNLLPRETPRLPGWEFAAHWQPAREVAGDFYDFIPEDGGRLGLVIGDVSDKGMPAALFMAFSRTVIRASLIGARTPVDGVAHANRLICADTTNSMFVTLFYAQIDLAPGEITYVNAGHNPAWLYRTEAGDLTRLTRSGMALGVDDTTAFAQRTVRMNPGDFVVLYTDGVTDALNADEQEFGLERLRHAVFVNRRRSAAELVAVLEGTLREFTGPTAPFDDITLVAAKRL